MGTAACGQRVQGKGSSKWRSANWRRQLQATARPGVMPNPPTDRIPAVSTLVISEVQKDTADRPAPGSDEAHVEDHQAPVVAQAANLLQELQ